MNQTSV